MWEFIAIFFWILGLLADAGLVKGRRIGIDATNLEANAAMRSIAQRTDGQSDEEFLQGLAQQSGIATPTREDQARVDRTSRSRAARTRPTPRPGRRTPSAA